jgi:hypothetical protein
VKRKRLWPWMYHFSLELRQKISVRVTVQQLADFVVYLFEIKQLVPSTIKGYRSAIGRTISLLGGPDFGQAEVLETMLVLARLVQ